MQIRPCGGIRILKNHQGTTRVLNKDGRHSGANPAFLHNFLALFSDFIGTLPSGGNVKLFDVRRHGHGSSAAASQGQPETSLRLLRMPKIEINSTTSTVASVSIAVNDTTPPKFTHPQ
jgi:hypothetical protein